MIRTVPAIAPRRSLVALVLTLLLAACASLGSGEPVVIRSHGANAVSLWDEVGNATANAAPSPAGATPEERRGGPDIATMHVAIYDAVITIAGTHQPFVVRATAPSQGASMDAAAHEAAYRVLKGLFPSRGALYQAHYDKALAELPGGEAKARGMAIGAEVAAGVLAWRANDGRSVTLPRYVPGTGPGAFRGVDPINQTLPHWRPFALERVAQFRPSGPRPMTSAQYAADLEEVRSLAGTSSTKRTPEQAEVARFYTEPPPPYWARNFRRFATASPSLADNARLMAMISVAFQDAIMACFDAKYTYHFWRPTTAIREADTDGNAATWPEPAWAPFLPTPNHPEYPSAHACGHGALGEVLRGFYGTPNVTFELDSTVTGTTRRFSSVDAMNAEVSNARVWGGMHFRFSNDDGTALGAQAARWMLDRRFKAR